VDKIQDQETVMWNPKFPCLSFLLPPPVICSYSRQILWDANALIIPKPSTSPAS